MCGLLSLCFGGAPSAHLKQQQERNKQINNQLRLDARQLKRTIVILLLGAAECGKSTVLKQMRIAYGRGFGEDEKRKFTIHVRVNVLETLIRVIRLRQQLDISYDSEECQKLESDFLEKMSSLARPGNPDQLRQEWFPDELVTELSPVISRLWADQVIQTTISSKRDFFILDSARHFLSKVHDIFSPEYAISDDDIVRARNQTIGIQETEIVTNIGGDKATLKITDVGGQRQERKKWIRCFDNVENLIYVFSLADYTLDVPDSHTKMNRFHENLDIFDNIINNDVLMDKNVVVFLNKKDVFEERLVEKRIPLSVCFPEYPSDNFDKEEAIRFLQQQIEEKDQSESKNRRALFFHATCATDTSGFHVLLRSVVQSIIDRNLEILALA